MKNKDSKVAELCEKLAHIRRRKDKILIEVELLNKVEKEVAFDLNGALGIIPVQEAAERVRWIMEKSKELATRHRADAMKRLWASKSPEERALWKSKLGKKKIVITTLEVRDGESV